MAPFRTIGTRSPSRRHWATNLTTAQTARLFALLDPAIADTVIAFYDAKYTYTLWRPVTAIRAADTDDNPDTMRDPNWLPETRTTAGDPSCPGAHGTVSAAGAAVLASVSGATSSASVLLRKCSLAWSGPLPS